MLSVPIRLWWLIKWVTSVNPLGIDSMINILDIPTSFRIHMIAAAMFVFWFPDNKMVHFSQIPGPWFNIKMSSYQYGKSHCGDKTVVRSSYLHNGISHTGKMSSLYWIGALVMKDNSFGIIVQSQYYGGFRPSDAESQASIAFVLALLTTNAVVLRHE